MYGSSTASLECGSCPTSEHPIRVPGAWCNEQNDFINNTDATKILFRSVIPLSPSTTQALTVQGQCTVAIVMLDSFDPGSLPGETAGGTYKYYDADVASFEDLWNSAGLIEMNCALAQKELGWAPGGKHSFLNKLDKAAFTM